MPASTPPLPPETLRSRPPQRGFGGDSQGVSEVIGYILVFGILSMLLVLSMTSFNIAQGSARERAVELRAESAAARVAGVLVQTAILAERESASAAAMAYRIDLPADLEGMDYQVHLEPRSPAGCTNACTYPDRVRISVPAIELTSVTAPLFSASAPANVHLCATTAAGGAIQIRYDVPTGLSPACTLPAGVTKGIFLQVTA
jgi:hypothetical protein